MTNHLYGWADLDAQNTEHYSRKPKELVEAEQETELAYSRFDRLVDQYYDEHYGDRDFYAKVVLAEKAAHQAQDYQTAIYLKYYGQKE